MNARPAVRLRPAVHADIPAMSAILGRAFLHDDPFGGFLFPDPIKRGQRQGGVSGCPRPRPWSIPCGGAEVAEIDEEIVGVCLWEGPTRHRAPLQTMLSWPELLWAMRTRVFAGMAIDRDLPTSPRMSRCCSGSTSAAIPPTRAGVSVRSSWNRSCRNPRNGEYRSSGSASRRMSPLPELWLLAPGTDDAQVGAARWST